MTGILTITDSDLENGVEVLPALGADGNVRILVVNHKWRMDRTTDLEITLDGDLADLSILSHYVIDAAHSNYYDQGSGSGVLETITVPTVTAGVFTITMEPRSVHLFVVGEAVVESSTPLFDTTNPQLASYSSNAALATFGTAPQLATYTTAPSVAAYGTVPAVASFASSPALASYDEPEPTL